MTFAKLCVFLTVCLAASDVLGGTVPINDGKYILETRVTLAGVLTVKVTAETTGWVGWGLSPNGSMILSDLVIGGFDASKGSYIGVGGQPISILMPPILLQRLYTCLIILFNFRIASPPFRGLHNWMPFKMFNSSRRLKMRPTRC